MQHTPQTYSAALLVLFCFSTMPSQADTTDITEKKSEQQLQSILQELDNTAKQRQQQNIRLETLSRQLECNWALLRAYEACGQLQENTSNERMSCSATAKQNAARCLGTNKNN